MKRVILVGICLLGFIYSAFTLDLQIGDVLDTTLCDVIDARNFMYSLKTPGSANFINKTWWDHVRINTEPNRKIISIQYQKQNVHEDEYRSFFEIFLDYAFEAGFTESVTNVLGGIPAIILWNTRTLRGFSWIIVDGWIVVTVASDVRPFLPRQ